MIGDARGVEPLLAEIKGSGSVSESAAEALAKIGTPAVGGLVALLDDSDMELRRRAAETLRKIGWQPGLDRNGASYWAVKKNWAKCIEIGAPADEPLIALLRDSDDRARWEAAEALTQIGLPAVEPLIAAFKDSEWKVRQVAASALGTIGDARAVEPLIAALKDSDKDVRQLVVQALGKIGEATAVEPLIAALKDSDEYVRICAARHWERLVIPAPWGRSATYSRITSTCAQAYSGVLGKIGNAHAVEPLITAVKENDSDVRQYATMALGKIGYPRAFEPLITALKDSEVGVRKHAAEALGKIMCRLWSRSSSH